MSKSIFVGRHSGAMQWMHLQGVHIDEFVSSLDVSQIERGDAIYGTLPLHLIAALHRRGASFTHISLDIPEEYRGKELSAEQMIQFGAKLENVTVQLRNRALSDKRGTVLFMLASGEQLQNYLPALFLNPTKAVILATPEMLNSAHRLQDALRKELPSCDVHVLKDMPTTRMEATIACDIVLENMAGELHPQLNITGATKALSGALEEVGRNFGADIFYWHGQAQYKGHTYINAIEWIVPRQEKLINSGLRPSIKAIALLNGYQVTHEDSWIAKDVRTDVMQLAAFLLAPENAGVRNLVNEVSQHINPKRAKREGFPAEAFKDVRFEHLSRLLLDLNILLEHDGCYFFNGEIAFNLVAQSQWLEVYLFVHLQKCMQNLNLRDISHSLRIQPSGSSKFALNDDGEIDVALMQGDVFWAFECKNVNFHAPGAKLDRALRQVDAYAQMVGGKFARKVLFSADSLPTTKILTLKRMNIDLLAGHDIVAENIQSNLSRLLA
jgi:CRISPR-associated protein Csx16